jgi:hypothetical protein
MTWYLRGHRARSTTGWDGRTATAYEYRRFHILEPCSALLMANVESAPSSRKIIPESDDGRGHDTHRSSIVDDGVPPPSESKVRTHLHHRGTANATGRMSRYPGTGSL